MALDFELPKLISELEKIKPITEAQEFKEKFSNKKKNYKIKFNTMGEILSCETEENDIIKYYEALNIDNNNIEYLSKIQALETLNNMKKEYNVQRFNIHKTIGKRYDYSF